MDQLYIVIPAYNEEANIESVAREWHEVVKKIGLKSKLVVVNDGSKDNTYSVLKKLNLAQLIAIDKKNGGHGSAILHGYKYALDHEADYIFQTDSDGQTLPGEFWELWKERKSYDIQIGHRNKRQDGLSRVVVTKTLKLVLFASFGIRVRDANTPFRLMSAESLKKQLPHIPKDYHLANVILTVLYQKSGAKMRYIPITFRPRQGGVNSINTKRIAEIGKRSLGEFRALQREISKISKGAEPDAKEAAKKQFNQ